MTVLTVALLAVGAWLPLGSPWLRVRQVDVAGLERLSRSEVDTITAPELGSPLVLAPTETLARRIRALQVVKEVRVLRVLPSTLRVEIVERQPVAALPSGRTYRLVDAEGVVVDEQQQVVAGIPVLHVDLETAGVDAMTAALVVVRELPPDLLRQVRHLGATSADHVWLRLTDGSRVVWGDRSETRRKAEVLGGLRKAHRTPARSSGRSWVYDVSAPNAPAVSPGRLAARASRAIRRHAPAVVESARGGPYRPNVTRLT